MTTAKTATNWTDAQVKALETGYNGDNTKEGLEALCSGKTAPAIRSKLVSLGIYEKADAVKKPVTEGGTGRKIEIVNAVEIFAGLAKGSLASLEKAAKGELELLAKRMTELSDQYNATIPKTEPDQAVVVTVDGYETQDVEAEVQTSGM